MNIMKTIHIFYGRSEVSEGEASRPQLLKNWLRFVCSVLLIILFMFFLAPWLQKVPSIRTLSRYIEESGIDAGAVYYTEVEEVGDADLAVRNTFRFYLPKK